MPEVVVIKGTNNLNFQPMQVLYNLITQKIADINSARAAKPTSKERQWVFPTFPESNDENYPRVALINDNVRFVEYGSARYISSDRVLGNVTKIREGVIATLPLTIGVFVKKRQRHTATLWDGTSQSVQNSKQADFIGDLVAKIVNMYHEQYFIPENMDIKVVGVSKTYDDNDFLLAKNIECEIEMFDEWYEDYTDPGTNVRNIANIDMSVSTI